MEIMNVINPIMNLQNDEFIFYQNKQTNKKGIDDHI